jgi:hypothetical protein
MKYLPLIIAVFSLQFCFAQNDIVEIYGGNDIKTPLTNFDASCNGPSTTIFITLPPGEDIEVTGIDVTYDYQSKSPFAPNYQQSRIFSQNTGLFIPIFGSSNGGIGAIENYNHTNLNIANGQYTGGDVIILEMQAWRLFGDDTGCNKKEQYVIGSSWTITLHHADPTIIPTVGINTSAPAAALDVAGKIRIADDNKPAFAGMIKYDEDKSEFLGFNGGLWKSFNEHNILIDGDGDTHIDLEKTLDEDKIRFSLNGQERWLMDSTRLIPLNTGHSVFIGEDAGLNDDLTDNSNIAVGFQALKNNTSGNNNIANGYQALNKNTTGNNNIANGAVALYSNTAGDNNIASGNGALYNNTTGNNNIANGAVALLFNSTGDDNIANGIRALSFNSTGSNNIASGNSALYSNTIGDDNIANGYEALYFNTEGDDNIAIGLKTLYYNTEGSNNIAQGKLALFYNTIGINNIAIGDQALYNNTGGSNNTASGIESLYSNTTGGSNSAIGYRALYSNTTGTTNIAVGYEALFKNTGGQGNIAVGAHSLEKNTIGQNNTGYGPGALKSNTEGTGNIAVGAFTLSFNTIGNHNSALGYSCFSSMDNYTNSSAFGFSAEPNASNVIRLGNSTIVTIGGYADWTNVSSDARIKTDVKEDIVGLEFINKLRPVSYHLDMDAIARIIGTPDSLRLRESEAIKEAEVQNGFIAQEVEIAADAVHFNFHGIERPKNDRSHYGLRYAEFTVPLVKAVQELSIQNELLQNKLKAQSELLKKYEQRFSEIEKQLDNQD